jgi:large subunit ribosomal protein L3
MRIGLIAQKVGMTRIFSSDGQHLPVTVLHVENCQILRVKKEKNFNIVQLGSFDQKANRLSKPM